MIASEVREMLSFIDGNPTATVALDDKALAEFRRVAESIQRRVEGDGDLSGPMTGRNGRHPLPDPHALARKLSAAGVSATTQVVAYDDAGGMFAGRLWWLLRWIGHERVALLDGGFNQWVKEGRELSREVPHSAHAAMNARKLRSPKSRTRPRFPHDESR